MIGTVVASIVHFAQYVAFIWMISTHLYKEPFQAFLETSSIRMLKVLFIALNPVEDKDRQQKPIRICIAEPESRMKKKKKTYNLGEMEGKKMKKRRWVTLI